MDGQNSGRGVEPELALILPAAVQQSKEVDARMCGRFSPFHPFHRPLDRRSDSL
jgi:hypothetical protein